MSCHNCFFLFHTISSTAVPVSLIISSQVAVQSGDSMDSEALRENPVTITFRVEGVGFLTLVLWYLKVCLTVTLCVQSTTLCASYHYGFCKVLIHKWYMFNFFIGSWWTVQLCFLELFWPVSIILSELLHMIGTQSAPIKWSRGWYSFT